MKPSLEALKKKFQEDKEKSANKGTFSKGYGDMYPFWNIKEAGERSVIRALPFKGQQDGELPFVEKLEHVLNIAGKDQKIACRKMYGESCPICDVAQKYYKDNDKVKGKYYYRDKKDLMSIYVVKDPLPADEETGENCEGKIKVIQLGYQVSKKFIDSLQELIAENEIDDEPWDLTNGRDFKLVKGMKGEYADWGANSSFVGKSTSLPDEILENFEPVDLRKYLPEDPGAEKVQRMLDAHFSGGDLDEDDNEESEEPVKQKVTESKKKPQDDEDDAPVAPKKKPVVEDEEDEEPVAKKPSKPAKPAVEEDAEDDEEEDFMAKLKRRAKGG